MIKNYFKIAWKNITRQKGYYIQKTFGFKALNGVIGDIYKDNSGSASKSLTAVKARISNLL